MADKTTQSMNDFLNYALRNVAPTWGSGAQLYLSLHVGSPAVGGNQTTNELDYVGYARLPIARNSSGSFSAAVGGSITNTVAFTFGKCTAAGVIPLPHQAIYIAIGENGSGAGTVLFFTQLAGVGITININSKPEVPIGALILQEA